MQPKRVGVDIAKSIFQIHGLDSHEQVKVRKQIRRQDFPQFFRQLAPCLDAMEACGGAHYWARELMKNGA